MNDIAELTVTEQDELRQLEATIERGMETFLDVGLALMEIRQKRLHRRQHQTFETYCQTRWQLSKRRVNQLIAAATVVQNLLPLQTENGNHGSLTDDSEEAARENPHLTPQAGPVKGTTVPLISNRIETKGTVVPLTGPDSEHLPLPLNERQARVLSGLDPDEQRDAWREAVATSASGKPTTAEIEEVVNQRSGRPKPIDTIRQWLAEGKIGKKVSSELEQLPHKNQSAFIRLVQSGQTPADAIRAISREPGDDADEATRASRSTPAAPTPRAELLDQTGQVVPDHLRDAYADTGLRTLIDELEQVEAMIRPDPWLARAGKYCDHYGFILLEPFKEHVWECLRELQLALEALRAGLPHAVCPSCQGIATGGGAVCRDCRGYGLVPEHRYGELNNGVQA